MKENFAENASSLRSLSLSHFSLWGAWGFGELTLRFAHPHARIRANRTHTLFHTYLCVFMYCLPDDSLQLRLLVRLY